VARILFLTQVLPYPLDSGARIRAYYVLRHLAEQHEVTLVSFTREDDRPEHIAHLEEYCQAVHSVPMQRSRLRDARALLLAGLTGQSAIIVRDEIGEMHAVLRRLIKEHSFDVVHADQTSMAQYALYARSQMSNGSQQKPGKLLLDAHNALYRIPERLAAHEPNPLKRRLLRRETRALARYEADVWTRFDHVVFVAEQDRQAFRPQVSHDGLHFTTIPICVDPEEKPLVQRVPHPQSITHLGTMFWPPNVEGVLWFAREVFPYVQAKVPEAPFVIVGKNPPQEIQDLALKNHDIQVTGYVPHPAPYLAETAVFIVPLRAGGGMRVKIPDAWCWGVPIISTSIGAEGIDVQDGSNILIADTPETLAEAASRVLREPSLGQQLRENGRSWVDEKYNWRRVYSKWDEVYGRLVAR
jgi:glycosyltransferase involved in cell wall biosynthesis